MMVKAEQAAAGRTAATMTEAELAAAAGSATAEAEAALAAAKGSATAGLDAALVATGSNGRLTCESPCLARMSAYHSSTLAGNNVLSPATFIRMHHAVSKSPFSFFGVLKAAEQVPCLNSE